MPATLNLNGRLSFFKETFRRVDNFLLLDMFFSCRQLKQDLNSEMTWICQSG